jgi:hypothetical protein
VTLILVAVAETVVAVLLLCAGVVLYRDKARLIRHIEDWEKRVLEIESKRGADPWKAIGDNTRRIKALEAKVGIAEPPSATETV